MELFKASNQWANRPADERFWTLQDMVQACVSYYKEARESPVKYGDLRVQADNGEVLLIGKANVPARLTNYAFNQLSARVGAPPSYLSKLPATLAAQNLNHGLAGRGLDDTAKLLVHVNGSVLARCLVGEGYQRIWNFEIAHRLAKLEADGWKAPPARPCNARPDQIRLATEEDVLRSSKGGLGIKVGDQIGPSGLYASDRDMFTFLVHEDNPLTNPADPATPLNRGFFCWNSEVGDRSFGIMSFLYDAVCGNHIVWGAKAVQEIRIRHLGDARDRAFSRIAVGLKAYADASVSEDQVKITLAQGFQIAADKDDVIDAVLAYATKRKINVLNRKTVDAAFEVTANTPRFGQPNTPWGIAQGLTVVSQEKAYASDRVDLDRAAGKLMEMAF